MSEVIAEDVCNKVKQYLNNYLDGSLQYFRILTNAMDLFLDPAFVKVLSRMGYGKRLTVEEVEYWKTQVDILEEYVNDVKALIGTSRTIEDFIALGDKFKALAKANFGRRQATSA